MAARVEVTGLRAIINALGEVDKKAVKEIQKGITGAAKDVVKDAQSRVTGFPISNWGNWATANGRDLSFDPVAVADGLKVKANRFRKQGVNRGFGYDVVQSNAGGNVFEVIGDGSRVTTGQQFVDTIANRFGNKRPRILMPAYYSAITPELRRKIRDKIVDEARKAGLR